jgi:hypothetical protein
MDRAARFRAEGCVFSKCSPRDLFSSFHRSVFTFTQLLRVPER